MWPFHTCYIYGTWRSKTVGGLKSLYREKRDKPHKGGIFMGSPSHKKIPGELTPLLVYLNYLPISVSF